MIGNSNYDDDYIIMLLCLVLMNVVLKWCTVFVFFPPSFVCFSFSFLEFIKSAYGLRWMCCGVACYVGCTSVVKKW